MYMGELRQSTSQAVILAPVVDDSGDPISSLPAAETIGGVYKGGSISGGVALAPADFTYIDSGQVQLVLSETATDTLGQMLVVMEGSGLAVQAFSFTVLPQAEYDARNLGQGTPVQARAVRPPAFSIDVSRRFDGRLHGNRTLRIPAGDVEPNQVGLNIGPAYRDAWVETVGTPVVTGCDTLTATAVGRFSDGDHRWAIIELGGTMVEDDTAIVTVPFTLAGGGGDPLAFDVVAGESC